MAVGTFPQMSLMAYGSSPSRGRHMKLMVGLSLGAHLLLLLLIAGLRMPPKMERPLASYEVSLVTTPTVSSADPQPVSRPIEREVPRMPEPPVARPTPEVPKESAAPPQPVRLSPTPHLRSLEPVRAKPVPVQQPPKVRQETPPPPAPAPPVRHTEAKAPLAPAPPPPRPVLNHDVLRGIALPAEVPKLGQVDPVPAGTPKETRSQIQSDVQNILNKLTVPEPTSASVQHAAPPPARTSPPRPSVSEEVARQLQNMEQVPPKAERRKTPAPIETQVASKPPAARTPVTTLQASGVATGNPYLALVQRRISAQWTAPPVETSGQPLQVVVKFRMDKAGQVSDVLVERSSGNEYYDLAARRAVQSAGPLPPFPADMPQPYLDAHFSFAVGEPVS